MSKLYTERDIIEQGDYYSRHTSAMTGEGLDRKSDIAAELAHRDIQIDQLQARVAELEGEAIGEVGYMIQPNWDDPSKTKGVALVDKSLAPGTKLYTHPASADKQAVSVPKQWVDLMRELVKDLISEIKTKQKLKPDERVAEDLGAVREAIAMIAKQEQGHE